MLDTWFSSGLWPFSTLGWPDDTADLRTFYPTSVMETGHDILFFWVARMIMFGHRVHRPARPFHTVYLHGLIRAQGGVKMSKTKGNVQDPLELIAEYGTDALRLGRRRSASRPATTSRSTPTILDARRDFVNKLWNVGRFVRQLPTTVRRRDRRAVDRQPRQLARRWPNAGSPAARAGRRRRDAPARATSSSARRRAVQDFIWDEFCRLVRGDRQDPAARRDATARGDASLAAVFDKVLRLLHPFAPFVTEELWQLVTTRTPNEGPHGADDGSRPRRSPSIMVSSWPTAGPRDPGAESTIGDLVELIRGVRNLKAERGVEPGRFLRATVVGGARTALLRDQVPIVAGLARLEPLEVVESLAERPKRRYRWSRADSRPTSRLAELFDVARERARLGNEIARTEQLVAHSEGLLGRPGFVERAKAEVVAKERDKLAANRDQLERLQAQLAALGDA